MRPQNSRAAEVVFTNSLSRLNPFPVASIALRDRDVAFYKFSANMTEFLQQILNGLIVGSIYSLMALGYTMVYGILQLINFAHGDIVMVGAMTALLASKAIMMLFPGLPGPLVLALSVVAAMAVCVPLSLVIERVAYRPLRNAPRLAPLITAIGVSLTLQTFVMVFFGRNYHEFLIFMMMKIVKNNILFFHICRYDMYN